MLGQVDASRWAKQEANIEALVENNYLALTDNELEVFHKRVGQAQAAPIFKDLWPQTIEDAFFNAGVYPL